MERKNYILIAVLAIPLLLFSATPAEQVYKAYISGNMKQWQRILTEAQRNTRPSARQRLERVNFQYGYIAWCIGNQKYNEAREWIPRMEADLEQLEKSRTELSSVYAYKAALYGYRIGINKLQAPFLGPKSRDFAEKSIATDPNNPLGHQQYGNIQFYTPFLFGGSKEKAAIHLLKALQLMEEHKEQLQWNWNYLSLLTSIAELYYDTGDRAKAIAYLKKTLTIEPGYQWVKNEILPLYESHESQ